MCGSPDHSKMYAFQSVIFKLRRMRVCWENCVFPSVFVHVLNGFRVEVWIVLSILNLSSFLEPLNDAFY